MARCGQTIDEERIAKLYNAEQANEKPDANKATFLELFKRPACRKTALKMMYLWVNYEPTIVC